MTEGQYWDGDSTLAVAYREAERLRRERKNTELWLQGAYIYDVLCRIAPLPVAFAKKSAVSRSYLSEPYALTGEQKAGKEEETARQRYAGGKRFMEQFMLGHNRKYEKEETSCL